LVDLHVCCASARARRSSWSGISLSAVCTRASTYSSSGQKVVAPVAVAETDSNALLCQFLWPHVEARSRCGLPQLAVERAQEDVLTNGLLPRQRRRQLDRIVAA